MSGKTVRRAWPAWAVVAAYAVLTAAMTYPLVLQAGRAIPGDSFDGWQNYWNLWWVKVALLEQNVQPWFTNLLYHPTGVGLLFHTLNIFNGVTSLPVQAAAGLFYAYNAVVLFAFTIGGLGAYLLARWVLGPGASRWPAFLAGAIFTFSPFHMAHLLGHMQVISLEWIPFYVLYLLRALRGAAAGRWSGRDAGLAALFLILVALCDWYFVLYCLIFTAIAGIWAVVRAGSGAKIARVCVTLAAIGGVWAVALSPVLVPMIREARAFRFMVPDLGQSLTFSADLLAFVTPQEFHPLWGEWAKAQASRFSATRSEYTVFAGFTALVLAAVGVGWWRRPRQTVSAARNWSFGRGFWGVTLAIFAVLALGPALHVGGRADLLPGGGQLHLLYGFLARVVPFMEISRSVSRLDVMVMLALSVLAAGGLNALGRSKRASWAGAAAVAFVLFEFLPVPYPLSPPDTPEWYASLVADPREGAVLNLPMNWDRPWYLLYQTVHGKPLTVAYISRDDPRTLTERAPVLQHLRHLGPDILAFDLREQGEQVLADLGVRWVVLDRYKMPGGRERTYTEAASQEVFGGRTPAYQDDRLTVYKVNQPKGSDPYAILGDGWGAFNETSRTRSFDGEATLTVHAPQAGPAVVRIRLAPGSAPLAGMGGGQTATLRLDLVAGDNVVRLAAKDATAPVVVEEIVVSAGG